MIGEGKFRASTNEAYKIAAELNLVPTRNFSRIETRHVVADARAATTYRDSYEVYLHRRAYDFSLDDGSLFCFTRDDSNKTLLSYHYLVSPYDVISYSEFLDEFFGQSEDDERLAWEDYEEYRSQASLRLNPVPFRYDWSPSLYRPGRHPASHLHVGFRTEVRLGSAYVLTPVDFTLLIARQFYPSHWDSERGRSERTMVAVKNLREHSVPNEYWTGDDDYELNLK